MFNGSSLIDIKSLVVKNKILGIFLAALALIQFVRPIPNQSATTEATDITNVYEVPSAVHAVLMQACFDCHSNNTQYPWYSHVQPLGWWLQGHVDEGKQALNFSVFGSYKQEDHAVIFSEIDEVLREGSMPLKSYQLAHPEARLTTEEVLLVSNWASSLERQISLQKESRVR